MLPTPSTDNVPFDKVYEPAEDSFLLLDALEREKDKLNSQFLCPIVVEIGAGSGIVSAFVAKSIFSRSWSLATDINGYSCEAVNNVSQQNRIGYKLDVLTANLGDCLKPRSVDLLIFNPPYVPSEETLEISNISESRLLDLALDGGKNGMEITNRLLSRLDDLLSERGVAYILFCASNNPVSVQAEMKSLGWNADIVMDRRAGWEILTVIKFSRI